MPELPEVETVRRGLEPVMSGGVLERVDLRRPDLRFAFPAGLCERVSGQRITGLSRRAKYLLINLDNDHVLISHLGMSGSWRIEALNAVGAPGVFHHPRSTNAIHDHVVLHVTHGSGERFRIVYNDPRRFGFLLDSRSDQLAAHRFFADLGCEPTGNHFTAHYLAKAFAGKTTHLKAALLDQRIIAGLGNIYVCEALWRAGISPRRRAATLVSRSGAPTCRLEVLTQAIRDVIAEAIAAGGSSLRDHRQADGSLGYFQHGFAVYGREGEACPMSDCRGVVTRTVQSGRSTFHCTSCQR